MIKKLRLKIILSVTLSLLLVLTIIIGIAAGMNYRHVISSADGTLSMLADNDGTFRVFDFDPDGKDFEIGNELPRAEDIGDDDVKRPGEVQKKEDGPNPDMLMQGLSPELPYESRYFSVVFGEDGTIIEVNVDQIAAIDSTAAEEYALEVLDRENTRGFAGDYRYLVTATDAGTMILFLDCGRTLNSFHSFVLTSISVSAAGMCAVLLLLIFISKRIVRPFVENYEKQRRFITDAGHELKTPLTIIRADAELLEMECGDSQWLRDIREQTDRLTDLTKNLVFLAKMDEAPVSDQMMEFCITDVAEETLADFSAPAKRKQLKLHAEAEPLLSIRGEEASIRQMLSLLVENAVKYTPEQGEIRLRMWKERNNLNIELYNQTEYISREDLPHLFDRFYRTDRSRNSMTGGHGLGLSIVASVVRRHRGKIEASTEDEHSLTIRILLPIS